MSEPRARYSGDDVRVWDPLTLLTETQAALDNPRARCALATLRLDYDWLEAELGVIQAKAVAMAAGIRLARTLRPHDGIAQTDPGSFSLLITDLLAPIDAWSVAERLMGRLHEPFDIGARAPVRARARVAVVIGTAGSTADEFLAATREALDGNDLGESVELAVVG